MLPQSYQFMGDVQQKTAITFQFSVLSSFVIFRWPTTRPTWTENCVSKAEPASGCQTRLVQSLVQERWIHFHFFVYLLFVFHVERTLSGKDGANFCTLWPHTHKHTRRLEVGHVGSVKNTNNRKGSKFSFLLCDSMKIWLYEGWSLNYGGRSAVCLSAIAQHIAYTLHAIAHAILLLCICNVRYGIAYRLMTKSFCTLDSRLCDSILVTSWYRGWNSCHVIVWLISCVIKPLNSVLNKVAGKRLS